MSQLVAVDPVALPTLLDLLTVSFNAPRSAWELGSRRVDAWWCWGAPDVAGFAVYHAHLRANGRDVPTAAVAAVGVAPHARGSGVGAAMMTSALRRFRADGRPLAALYASTQRLYRKVGYELAGHRVDYAIATQRIGLGDRTLPVRPLAHPRLRELVRYGHGGLVRTEGLWARLLAPWEGHTQAWEVGDGDGYAVTWNQAPGPHFTWNVRTWWARDAAAARRLWTFLADTSSMAETVTWSGPPNDPMVTVLPDRGLTVRNWERWMLRICDLPAALAARGWLADGEVDLEVDDDVLPENAGRWRVRVDGGRAAVERGGDGAVALDIRALASLYLGYHTATELAALGLLRGDPEPVDRLFRAPVPWMSDHF